jgi:putative transferase (TIGR04331 family)
MSEIATYRRMVYEKYLSYFTIQLNLIQDMDEDSKYWGLIIGPWLIEYINLTEFLYRSGKNNTDLNFNLTNNIVPFDYTSFILLKNSLDFNKQLEYCYSKKEINTSSCTLSVAYESVGCSRFKSFSLACVELFLFKFVKNKIVLVDAYIGSANLISIFFKSKFKLIPYAMREQTPTKSINLRKNLRLWRVDVESSNDYELTLSENILNHIPYVYMEGFKSLRLSVKNLSPKMFVSSTGMYGNERLKVASAEIKKKKGVLIGMQHGGGPYGIANMNTVEIEIGNLDKFLTWGWESQENTQAFYSFRLSQLAADCKKTINPIPNKYLYLGTVIDMHATDGNPIPSGEVFKNCYILWQHRFFIGLNESIRKKIIYRGYPDDKRYG